MTFRNHPRLANFNYNRNKETYHLSLSRNSCNTRRNVEENSYLPQKSKLSQRRNTPFEKGRGRGRSQSLLPSFKRPTTLPSVDRVGTKRDRAVLKAKGGREKVFQWFSSFVPFSDWLWRRKCEIKIIDLLSTSTLDVSGDVKQSNEIFYVPQVFSYVSALCPYLIRKEKGRRCWRAGWGVGEGGG